MRGGGHVCGGVCACVGGVCVHVWGVCLVRGHTWQGDMPGRECMAGGMHGSGDMHGRGMHGRGVCVAGGHAWHAHMPPCGQTDTCENITFANFVCGR